MSIIGYPGCAAFGDIERWGSAPDPTPDPGDSLYEECLAVQGPEIPMTEEMIAAGLARDAELEEDEGVGNLEADDYFTAVYRAMAALAPKPTPDRHEISVAPSLLQSLAEKAMRHSEEAEAKDARIAALEAENAALSEMVDSYDARVKTLSEELGENLALKAALGLLRADTTFGPQTLTDLPDPPRRPDGTLAPEAKPWAPPRPAGDTRRVGS